MEAFSALLFAFTLAYGATGLLALVLLIWDRTRTRPAHSQIHTDVPLPFVSVLVAARNEEEALPRCLAALAAQDYAPGRIEFIIADDQSSDGTTDLVRTRAAQDPRFRLVSVRDSFSELRGKANALHQAFLASNGDVLLITDADCAPPSIWARHMVDSLADERLGASCGVARVAAAQLAEKVQALDWLLLLSIASAASAAGFPLTAMGNNMALRRAAYLDVGGYPALPFSVTEDYALFQAIHGHAAWNVRISLDPRITTDTLPLPSLKSAFQQRKRWARGGLDAGPGAYALYATVFLTHTLLLAGLLFTPALAASLLLLKCGADLALLAFASRRMGLRNWLSAFPAFEVFLFAYVALLPAALLIDPSIRWKERRF